MTEALVNDGAVPAEDRLVEKEAQRHEDPQKEAQRRRKARDKEYESRRKNKKRSRKAEAQLGDLRTEVEELRARAAQKLG